MTLADLREAVEAFAREQADEPALISAAVVIWEEVGSTDASDVDGGVSYRATYAVPVGSPTASVGLARLGEQQILDDLLSDDESR